MAEAASLIQNLLVNLIFTYAPIKLTRNEIKADGQEDCGTRVIVSLKRFQSLVLLAILQLTDR